MNVLTDDAQEQDKQVIMHFHENISLGLGNCSLNVKNVRNTKKRNRDYKGEYLFVIEIFAIYACNFSVACRLHNSWRWGRKQQNELKVFRKRQQELKEKKIRFCEQGSAEWDSGWGSK